jgi:hypothetical protein
MISDKRPNGLIGLSRGKKTGHLTPTEEKSLKNFCRKNLKERG